MRLAIFFMTATLAGWAQSDIAGLTVTASRPLSVVPDQVSVGIYVTTGIDATLDDVVAVLQGVKVAATDLSDVSTVNTITPTAWWAFTRTISLSDLSGTLSALATAEQNAKKAGMDVSFGLQGTSVSPQAQAAQPCPWGALVADAQTQASKLAGVAGVTLGPITAMTKGSDVVGAAGVSVARYSFVSNLVTVPDPTTSGLSAFLLGTLSYTAVTPSSACSLAVTFKLGQ